MNLQVIDKADKFEDIDSLIYTNIIKTPSIRKLGKNIFLNLKGMDKQ